eukprot:GCRY01003485.1.p1 GENE.GCRY01003485.1~~GCRY01003485.1.p1  ORF type:complete len:962 (+),score=292.69 GCRY01003485.1:205-3090(+)
MFDVHSVEQAFLALQDEKSMKEADKFLQSFQKSVEAWTICDQILRDSTKSIDFKVFLSTVFLQKIRMSFSELPLESASQLRLSLLELIKIFVHNKRVLTHLCLSMASVALKMTDWNPDSIIPDIVRFFNGGSTPEEIVPLLHILNFIPEELFDKKSNIPPSRKSTLRPALGKNQIDVLNFLNTCGEQLPGEEEQELVFHCATNWLKLVVIPVENMLNLPLLNRALSCLPNPSLTKSVSSLLEVLLYGRDGNEAEMPLAEWFIPKLTEMENLLKDFIEKDEEDEYSSLGFVFCEFASVFIDLLAQGFPQGVRLLMVLTHLVGVESVNLSIEALSVFSKLAECWGSEKAKKSVLDAAFGEVYQSLLHQSVLRARLPEDFANYDDHTVDDVYKFRFDFGEQFEVVVPLIGIETVVGYLLNSIRSCLQSNDPRSLEAAIFLLRWSGGYFHLIENSALVNSMMELVFTLPPQLQENQYIKYTSVSLIGEFDNWLTQSSQFCDVVMTTLFSAIQSQEKRICSAGCQTLLRLSKKTIPYFSTEQNIHTIFQCAPGLKWRKCRYNLFEALGNLTSALPTPQVQKTVITEVMSWVFGGVKSILDQHHDPLDTETVNNVCNFFEAAKGFLKYLRLGTLGVSEHPLKDVLTDGAAYLQSIFPRLVQSDSIIEEWVGMWRSVMDTMDERFLPFMQQLVEQLVLGFQKAQLSGFLYLAEKCVTCYGQKTNLHEFLTQLCMELTTVSFNLFQTSGLEENPDIVEDYFYLLSRYTVFCPVPLGNSDLISSLLQCAQAGLSVQHKKAATGVLSFIRRLFRMVHERNCALRGSVPSPGPGSEPTFSSAEDTTQYQGRVRTFTDYDQIVLKLSQHLENWGSTLLGELLKALAGGMPRFMGDDLAILMRDVHQSFPEAYVHWMTQLLGPQRPGWAQELIPTDAASAFAEKILNKTSLPSRQSYLSAVKTFQTSLVQHSRR